MSVISGVKHGIGAQTIAPGVVLTSLIAAQSFVLHRVAGLSIFTPMILAIVMGMIFQNFVGNTARTAPGIAICSKHVLRVGVALLGLQIGVRDVIAVGASGVLVLAATVLVTFAFTISVGKLLGLDRGLVVLIAAGTSVCGASAVVATNAVTRRPTEDVAYAVACVTIFGAASMFAYPMLANVVGLGEHAYGLWVGASVHEVAQVVAAGFQYSQGAGEFAVISKLTRVLMLAPMILVLGYAREERDAPTDASAGHRKVLSVPWFVLGFVALMLLNSFVALPETFKAQIAMVASVMLVMAMAAMGLETTASKLASKGIRPMLLGACAWGFISLFSLGLIGLVARVAAAH